MCSKGDNTWLYSTGAPLIKRSVAFASRDMQHDVQEGKCDVRLSAYRKKVQQLANADFVWFCCDFII